MKNNFKYGFTLVELIVVITILAVLATVAFISFQGYTSSSRDSVRLTDLKSISKSFEIMKTQSIALPYPEKSTGVLVNGEIISYQGELSQKILQGANVHGGGFDPLTKQAYMYSIDANRSNFQVTGFLENNQQASNNFIPESFANNHDYVQSQGDNVGIIYDVDNQDYIHNLTATGVELIGNATNFEIQLPQDTQTGVGQDIFSTLYVSHPIIKKDTSLAALDPSLVVYFDMQSSTMSGATKVLRDLSGNNNHGFCYNYEDLTNCGESIGPVFRDNGSMNFDGIDDYIYIPYNQTLVYDELTMYVKFKHSGAQEANAGGGWRLLSSQNLSYGYYFLRINDSFTQDDAPLLRGKPIASVGSVGNNEIKADHTSTINYDKINTLALSFGDKSNFYLNGASLGGNEITQATIDTKSGLTIASIGGLSENFSGEIYEVRVYNRALNDFELKNLD